MMAAPDAPTQASGGRAIGQEEASRQPRSGWRPRGSGARGSGGREWLASQGHAWPWSRGRVPFVLVAVALLGSVLIPARQTWLITDLLRETTDVIAPSRVTSAQLQSGLSEELATRQQYALSGDSLWLRRSAAVAADNDRR